MNEQLAHCRSTDVVLLDFICFLDEADLEERQQEIA
jgi:hypothetical protein